MTGGSQRKQPRWLQADYWVPAHLLNDTLIKAARDLQRPTSRKPARQDLPQAVTGAAEWSGVADSFQAISSLVGAPPMLAAIALLKALFGIEGREMAILRSIKRDTELTRSGDFEEGNLHLGVASRAELDGTGYEEALQLALGCFISAHGVSKTTQEKVIVEFHLASVQCLLGNAAEAKHWMEESYSGARNTLYDLVAASNDVNSPPTIDGKPWRGPSLLLGAVMTGGAVFLAQVPTKVRKVWQSQLALEAAQQFVPFVNAVGACLNGVGSSQRPRSLAVQVSTHYSVSILETDVPEPKTPALVQKAKRRASTKRTGPPRIEGE